MSILPGHNTAVQVINLLEPSTGQGATDAARAVTTTTIDHHRRLFEFFQLGQTLADSTQRDMYRIIQHARLDLVWLPDVHQNGIFFIDDSDGGGGTYIDKLLRQVTKFGEQNKAAYREKGHHQHRVIGGELQQLLNHTT